MNYWYNQHRTTQNRYVTKRGKAMSMKYGKCKAKRKDLLQITKSYLGQTWFEMLSTMYSIEANSKLQHNYD